MVDAANRDRAPSGGIKVGGHQASSASMVSIMTALWFSHLDAEDRVAVKPHASPVLHAIQYLLGNLDRSYLARLRDFGGLQAYPSRTKDPDPVDFSTGSVGLGAAAPLFAAAARRYVDAHFGPRPASRFVALIGDAELDEGSVWEAVADPATSGLGNVMWVVDFNRQSLDRVVPGTRIHQWRSQFEAAGWHVVEVKYGHRLRDAFTCPGGDDLRSWIDAMPNEQYQSLFSLVGGALRERFLEGAPDRLAELLSDRDDDELRELVTDLGGHDIHALLDAFDECDRVVDRPSVVFAYTVKGWGLPTAGNPRNHSALLTPEQMQTLRDSLGIVDDDWPTFAEGTDESAWVSARRVVMSRDAVAAEEPVVVPPSTMRTSPGKPVSTQEAFGRILTDLSRNEQVSPHLVTTAPDVATSTNLAGFINRLGVFSPEQRKDWQVDPALRWSEGPAGQHLELGISEMNLFILLGQLGLTWDLSSKRLIPVGTVYDPFVLRGLDAFLYSVYSGASFVVAGTPSGITLAPEGGAHQSTITPSVGLELPCVTFHEPAYAAALDWLLCDAIGRVGRSSRAEAAGAFYFRLSTRPVNQSPFEEARARLGEEVLRRQVLAGAYRLHDSGRGPGRPTVTLAASGAVVPEALEAALELESEGVHAVVVDITSSDRLYRDWQTCLRRGISTATVPDLPGALRTVFPDRTPLVTVHDASSHHLAWLGAALGTVCVPVGVDSFGQSGSVRDLYSAYGLEAGSIVNAALAALSLP